jgi:hypothetical protein
MTWINGLNIWDGVQDLSWTSKSSGVQDLSWTSISSGVQDLSWTSNFRQEAYKATTINQLVKSLAL